MSFCGEFHVGVYAVGNYLINRVAGAEIKEKYRMPPRAVAYMTSIPGEIYHRGTKASR